jgi:Holliday junction resolvase
MHKSEQEIQTKLEQEGWTVYRNGWPDFAAEKDGVLRLVEVKTTDDLSTAQVLMRALLERHTTAKVEVLYPSQLAERRRARLERRRARLERRERKKMEAEAEVDVHSAFLKATCGRPGVSR